MLLTKIQALIAALQAQDWSSAFMLAVAIGQEIYLDLTKQGKQPHVLKGQFSSATDMDGLIQQLQSESAATAPNWGNILAILAALLKVLLPLVA